MSETRICHMEYSGDTGYGATMSRMKVCEDVMATRPQTQAKQRAETVQHEVCYDYEGYYGLTGIGGMFISMLWRHASCR